MYQHSRSAITPAGLTGCEGGREGAREGVREGGSEGGKERGREGVTIAVWINTDQLLLLPVK